MYVTGATMRICLIKTVSKAVGARLYSTKNFKKVTHCIFDMDGLLLGKFCSVCDLFLVNVISGQG